MLADSGGFCIEAWHVVPPRPELRKLFGVEMVEIPVNYIYRTEENKLPVMFDTLFILVQ